MLLLAHAGTGFLADAKEVSPTSDTAAAGHLNRVKADSIKAAVQVRCDLLKQASPSQLGVQLRPRRRLHEHFDQHLDRRAAQPAAQALVAPPLNPLFVQVLPLAVRGCFTARAPLRGI